VFVHISLVCIITVWAGDSAYGVSTTAPVMLSNHMSVEYADKGIRSNTLLPGELLTPEHDSAAAASNDAADWTRRVLERHPIGRSASWTRSRPPRCSYSQTNRHS
jgi:NAD(P)-dependent dehydrogenase (short-subunit alcohol dehydrogenase family)